MRSSTNIRRMIFGVVVVCLLGSSAFGAPRQHIISGFVQTSGGSGVEGVNVAGDNGASSAVTDANGAYSVTVPNNWSGTITVSKTGWLITPASKTYSNIRENITNENYTAYQPKISGYVRKTDGTALSGVSISATNSGGISTTDATGYYQIIVPYNWSGNITAAKSGYNITPSSIAYSNVISDQSERNYTAFQPVISGCVLDKGGTGLADVNVTANNSGGVVLTNSGGYYSISVPYNWSGTLTPNKTGLGFVPINRIYSNITSNQTGQDFTGGGPLTISGRVYNIEGGIGGVQISGNNGAGTVVTDADGIYIASVPYGWSGQLVATKAGMAFSPAELTFNEVIEGLSGQDFTETKRTLSVTRKVSHSYDDGSCWRSFDGGAAGGWNGATLVVGSDGYEEESMCGFRFANVDIPKKAVILGAYLTAKRGNYILWGPVFAKIAGEYIDNAPNFYSMGALIYSRPTTSYITWSLDPYYTPHWDAGTWITSPNISSIVRQIINRNGWSAGNAMAFFVKAQYYDYYPGYRSFYSYDHSSADGASIEITYEYPPLISGYVRDDNGTGVESVTVTANNGGESSVTDSNGYYKVRVPGGWSGSVRPYKEFWVFDLPQREYQSLYSDRTGQNFTGIAPVTISGYVKDSSGLSLEYVSISASNGGGTATTDSAGYYEAPVPYGWSGLIYPEKRLWFFEPNQIEYFDVTENLTNQNFLGTSGYIISGYVHTEAGTEVEGVYINADNGAHAGVTNSEGYYEVAVLPNWFGTITPVKKGRKFVPASISYGNLVTDLIGQDFIASNLINVGTNGDGAFANIQAAIDEALEGDVIVVHPGKYAGFYADKPAITIRSIDPGNPAVVAATIIESEGSVYGNETVINGLSFIYNPAIFNQYYYDYYGGIYVGSYAEIRNCRILNFPGAGIYVSTEEQYPEAASIKNCVISNNGYFNWGITGGIIVSGSVIIENCLVTGNFGGGISVERSCYDEGKIHIYNSTIADNFSDITRTTGGGINYNFNEPGFMLSLQNSIISNAVGPNDVEIFIDDGYSGSMNLEIAYSDVRGGLAGVAAPNDVNFVWGQGNIDVDPCFAQEECWLDNNTPEDTNDDLWIGGDFHLKSAAGRWEGNEFINMDAQGDGFLDLQDFAILAAEWQKTSARQLVNSYPYYPYLRADVDNSGKVDEGDLLLFCENYLERYNAGQWVYDDANSKCIDAGDPNSDWTGELWPHGKRINMGAYGGTPQASMSPSNIGNIANLDNDANDMVYLVDLALFVDKWLYQEALLSADLDRDGDVDFTDFDIFAENWLAGK